MPRVAILYENNSHAFAWEQSVYYRFPLDRDESSFTTYKSR